MQHFALYLALSVLDSWQPGWILGAGTGESANCHRDEERAFTRAGKQAAADGGPGINSHSPFLVRMETDDLFLLHTQTVFKVLVHQNAEFQNNSTEAPCLG